MPQENKYLTDDIIAKKCLLLLKNNCVMAGLIHRQYEQYFVKKVGSSIDIRLPSRVKSASGRVLEVQPMVDVNTSLKIKYQEHVGFEWTMQDKTLDITQFGKTFLASGITQIANKIDTTCLLQFKKAWHSTGTPGVRNTKFINFATAAAKQTIYSVPNDGMRIAVLNPYTTAHLSDEVTKLFNAKLVKESYQKGYMGDVSNYGTHTTQNLPSHTVGNYGGTPLVRGAGVNGDTLQTDGWTPGVTGLLKMGDVLTTAGVYGVNAQSYTTTGELLEHVVTEDVNSDSQGRATIKIGAKLNDGEATTMNDDGRSVSLKAYQNITALPLDNAVITVLGDAGTTYEQDFLFHPDACTLAMVNLELPRSAVSASRAHDPDSGLSLSMTEQFDIREHTEITRVDALWGTELIYGDLAMRMWGQNLGA